MSYYEYRVVPAPTAAPRTKGVKGTDARFAHGLSEALNREGRDGWEFQRSETMSVEAKSGFFSRTRYEQVTVMIFRRWVETTRKASAPRPELAAEAPAKPQSGAGLTATRRPTSPFPPMPRTDRT